MEVVDDGAGRGIRAASSTAGGFIYIDYDEVQEWGVATDRLSYGLFMTNTVSDAPGAYEIVASYSPTQVGTLAGSVAGVENATGTSGIDTSAMIAPGVQICYDAIDFAEGYEVTFSVVPETAYSGQAAAPVISVESDMEGTSTLSVAATAVELTNVAPIANAGADATYDRADVEEITLDAVNTVDYDTDRLAYRWQQISGEDVTIRGGNSLKAYLDVDDMANGTYTFQLSVDDGEFNSSDTVTITVTGKEEESDGIGSMGILLLLGLPLLFRRRYSR